jgi:hypothetical protein
MRSREMARLESIEVETMNRILRIVISAALLTALSQSTSAQETATVPGESAEPCSDYPYAGGNGMRYGNRQTTPGSVRGLGYPYADQAPYPCRGRGAGYGPGGRGYGYGYPGYRGQGGSGYPGHRQYGNPPFYRADGVPTD